MKKEKNDPWYLRDCTHDAKEFARSYMYLHQYVEFVQMREWVEWILTDGAAEIFYYMPVNTPFGNFKYIVRKGGLKLLYKGVGIGRQRSLKRLAEVMDEAFKDRYEDSLVPFNELQEVKERLVLLHGRHLASRTKSWDELNEMLGKKEILFAHYSDKNTRKFFIPIRSEEQKRFYEREPKVIEYLAIPEGIFYLHSNSVEERRIRSYWEDMNNAAI